jgi:hypothetical protein
MCDTYYTRKQKHKSDRCCLPVLSTKGHLFCKACVYEHLLAQKQHHKKQLEKWNAQRAEQVRCGTVCGRLDCDLIFFVRYIS